MVNSDKESQTGNSLVRHMDDKSKMEKDAKILTISNRFGMQGKEEKKQEMNYKEKKGEKETSLELKDQIEND